MFLYIEEAVVLTGGPASRAISRPGGTVIQDLGYSYDAATGNLASRSDRVLSSDGTVTFTEEFAYDNLNRLREAQMNSVLPAPSDTSLNNTPPYIYDNISAGYDERGNVLSHDKFMAEYGETDPYAFGYVQWSDGEYWMEQYMPRYAVPMTSFDRPVSVADTLCVNPWGGGGFWSKIVGSHGYTGHEHIVGCGLINANARIYDPFLGRFLSPDPLIQDPASTQNFNRYAYCFNNPLKYTDEDGEFIGTIRTAAFRAPISFYASIYKAIEGGINNGWKGARNGFSSEWVQYGHRVSNAFKIDMGLFKTDEDAGFGTNLLTLFSRFTWESQQRFLGNSLAHIRNNLWRTNVDYYHEATLVNRTDKDDRWGVTLGSYINGKNLTANPRTDAVFAHEYGHVKQSKLLGPAYTPIVGHPSLIGSALDGVCGHDHNNEWYEVWANNLANDYYTSIGDKTASATLKARNPLSHSPEWYDAITGIYYLALLLVPHIF